MHFYYLLMLTYSFVNLGHLTALYSEPLAWDGDVNVHLGASGHLTVYSEPLRVRNGDVNEQFWARGHLELYTVNQWLEIVMLCCFIH